MFLTAKRFWLLVEKDNCWVGKKEWRLEEQHFLHKNMLAHS